MSYLNPDFVRYGDFIAIVLDEYADSNNRGTLYNLFVLSNPPHTVNGVSAVDLFGNDVEPSEDS